MGRGFSQRTNRRADRELAALSRCGLHLEHLRREADGDLFFNTEGRTQLARGRETARRTVQVPWGEVDSHSYGDLVVRGRLAGTDTALVV